MKSKIKMQQCKGFPVDSCNETIVSRPNALYCDTCRAKAREVADRQNRIRQEEKRKAQRSAFLANPEARKFKPASDADVLHWMGYMIKQISDVGEHGPVVHYDCNHPEFARIAALYQ